MSQPNDESLAEQYAIDDALDHDRDPFAGDDPPDGYLEEKAEEAHRREEHAGGPCTCRRYASAFCADARRTFPISDEAPF